MTYSLPFSPLEVAGKKLLVIAGRPREELDGVRHYANHARPEDQGFRIAEALKQAGANVTVIAPASYIPAPESTNVISHFTAGEALTSTADLLAAARRELASGSYNGVLQLAAVPSLRPANISATKLKVKDKADAVTLDVCANTDLLDELSSSGVPTIGYDNRQQLQTGDDDIWKQLIESGLHHERIAPVPAPAPQLQPRGILHGKRVIVTGGPTAETLTENGDVISNFSTGTQALQAACALADLGAEVTFITGPTLLADPAHKNIRTQHVRTAREMHQAAMNALPADAFIGIAAVADFRVDEPITPQFKDNGPLSITMTQNPDILSSMGHAGAQRPAAVIGFAAENNDLATYAKGKLEKKNADGICANDVKMESLKARGVKNNHVQFFTHEGMEDWGAMSKYDVGAKIGQKVAHMLCQGKPFTCDELLDGTVRRR